MQLSKNFSLAEMVITLVAATNKKFIDIPVEKINEDITVTDL